LVLAHARYLTVQPCAPAHFDRFTLPQVASNARVPLRCRACSDR
jgi:hypothetical protein